MQKFLFSLFLFLSCILNAQNLSFNEFITKNITFKNDTIGVNSALKLNNVLWIDARSYSEFSVGTIPNSININAAHPILNEIFKTPKSQTIIVVSNFGYRADILASELRKHGFTNVKVLYGGLIEWINLNNNLVNDKNGRSYLIHLEHPDHAKFITNNNFIPTFLKE